MYRKVPFTKGTKAYYGYQNVPKYTKMYRKVPKRAERYQNVPKFTKIYHNVPFTGYQNLLYIVTKMYQNIPKVLKGTKIY